MFEKYKNHIASLLRSTERYTNTDMIYLTKGGFALSTNQVIAMLFSFGLSIGFANLVPKEVFGNYQFILSAAAMIGAFSLVGIPAVVNRAAAKGYDGVLEQGFLMRLRWNIGIIAIAGIASLYYFLNTNTTLGFGFIIAGTFLPFLNSFSLYQSFLSGKKFFGTAARYGIAQNTIPALLLLLTIWLTDSPIVIVLVYYAATTTTIGFLYTLTLKRHVRASSEYPDLWYEGKHNTLVNILDIATDQLDKLLVFHFLGAIQLAIYAFALAPIKQLRSHNKILKSLALPKFVQNDISTLKATLPQKLFLYFLVLILLVTLYILAAPLLYKFLFPQYIDAVLYSQVLALTLLFLPITTLQKVFAAHFKKREIYIANLTPPLTNIVLLATLVPFFGIWGVIASLLGTRIMNTVVVIFLFGKLR